MYSRKRSLITPPQVHLMPYVPSSLTRSMVPGMSRLMHSHKTLVPTGHSPLSAAPVAEAVAVLSWTSGWQNRFTLGGSLSRTSTTLAHIRTCRAL